MKGLTDETLYGITQLLTSENHQIICVDDRWIFKALNFEPSYNSNIQSIDFLSIVGWDVSTLLINSYGYATHPAQFMARFNEYIEGRKKMTFKFSNLYKWVLFSY